MTDEPKQIGLFKDIDTEKDEPWRDEWKGMPEFDQENREPYKRLIILFKNREDFDNFSKLVDQKMTSDTESIWFPKKTINWRTRAYYDGP
jgi:hypothetical protein